MGNIGYFITVLVLSVSVNTQAWSWNSDDSNSKQPKQEIAHTSKLIPEQNTSQNPADVELVIEAILSLKPQGNNTKEVDEVYRRMIRDKLCSLGLRNCELNQGNNPPAAAKGPIHVKSTSPNSGHKYDHTPSPHPQQKLYRPPRKQSSNFSGSSQNVRYKPQYRGSKIPQKHIHHHFHYNNHQVPLVTESNDAQAVSKKTSPSYGSSNQLGSKSNDRFGGYSLETTTSTLEVTLGSTELPMQSTRLDDNDNLDCTCVPYGQCPTHVLDENENQQPLLDPRRLKRDMHSPQKSEIRIFVDHQGKVHFIRVPSNPSLNIADQEGSRMKREPPVHKKPEVKIFGHPKICEPKEVCCKKSLAPRNPAPVSGQCGTRNPEGVTGRIKNPVQVDGDSDFGEYPWQVAILKRAPEESGFICGGTLIDSLHIITAAHCVRKYIAEDLKVRLGEWEVNHDTEFFSYVESDISTLLVHPNFYSGTLHNDLAILRMEKPVDLKENPHINSACLPSPHEDFTGATCWTTGWGKDAFGENGKYQNILQEIDVPIVDHEQCQTQLQNTRLGHRFKLHPGFICAGGEGKDACKGDGGGPMVCERGGIWSAVGIVSWGIGCGQIGVPGVYVKVSHYLDWIEHNIKQI